MGFKTHAEIFKALLDGQKITCNGHSYIELVKGQMKDKDGDVMLMGFGPNLWYIFEEPKKQVWQWRTKKPGTSNWVVECYLWSEVQVQELRPSYKYEKHAGPFDVSEL